MRQSIWKALLGVGLLVWSAPLAAQSYAKLWKEADAAIQKDLPRSALQQVNEIAAKAEREGNFPQGLKARMAAVTYREQIAPDSLYTDLQRMEAEAVAETDPVHRSMRYLVLAQLYERRARRVPDDNRQTVPGERPQSLSAWTQQMLLDRAWECCREVFADLDCLGAHQVGEYEVLVERGKESRYFHHDLLSLMAHEVQSLLGQWSRDDHPQAFVEGLYDRLVAHYTTRGNRDAALLMALDRAAYLYRYASVRTVSKDGSRYQTELHRLLRAYGDCATAARVYEDLVGTAAEPEQAMQWCREALERYPRYERADFFRNKIRELTCPLLSFSLPKVMALGDSIRLDASVRNLPAVEWRIREAVSRKVIDKGVYPLAQGDPDYAIVSRPITLAPVTVPGDYVLEVMCNKEKKAHPFLVTSLCVLWKGASSGHHQAVVLDRRSGHPIPGATVELLERDHSGRVERYTLHETCVSDAAGLVTFADSVPRYIGLWAYKAGCGHTDTLRQVYLEPVYRESGPTEARRLYTDRAVYRPGQTIQVSGLLYEQDGRTARVVPRRKLELELKGPNGEGLGRREVESNAFGSFSTQFTLPAVCLPGRYVVRSERTAVSFRVEEYKRPTFTVEMLPIEQTYALGDSLQVLGRAWMLTGTPVQRGKVTYTVHRAPFYWRDPKMETGEVLAAGEVWTDEQGHFAVPVRLTADETDGPGLYPQLSYRVKVEVTNAAGETQTGYRMLRIGVQSLQIIPEIPAVWVRHDTTQTARVQVQNVDGKPVEVQGRLTIHRLTTTDGQVALYNPLSSGEGTFVAGKPLATECLDALPSGKYRLRFEVDDAQGRRVCDSTDIVTFAWDDSRIPVPGEVVWHHSVTPGFGAGKENKLCIGTSADDLYLMYDVLSGDRVIESRSFVLSDTLMTFHYDNRPEYAEGLTVQWAALKEGRLYTGSASILPEEPRRELTLRWETFRDRLTPGEHEEWRLHIVRPDGRPAHAELMATMYDTALDAYSPLNWDLSWYPRTFLPWLRYERLYEGFHYTHFTGRCKPHPLRPWAYNHWLPGLLQGGIRYVGNVFFAGLNASADMRVRTNAVAKKSSVAFVAPQILQDEEALEESAAGLPDSPDEVAVDPRSDFNETAFFYPHIQTDSAGVATIAFTLPQSLTTWKFMGLAHTADMLYGRIEGKVTVSKDFMLQQHLPRFVRAGDEAVLSALLDNRSTEAVKGTVHMQLFDPMTEKVVYEARQPFALEQGASQPVTFKVKVSDAHSLLACCMTATSSRYSDGEQHYLPVLGAREWVSDTRTVTLPRAGQYTIALDSLFNRQSPTATQRRLTVEFTNNPLWMAVMALPSMATPAHDDALSLAAAYYAVRLGGWIVAQHPRLRSVFEAWKAQGGTEATLWSNLQQNQSLKAILLEETPWVAEAANEAEQHARLATLFDLNNMQAQASAYLAKLTALQRPDGSWSWFEGMAGSRYMTTVVVETLARLNHLTEGSYLAEMQSSLDQGLQYLGEDLVTEWREVTSRKEKGFASHRPTEATLHYLYIHTLYNKEQSEDVTSACGYFYGQLAGTASELNLYGKAAAAQILHQAGNTQTARDLVRSLIEYAVATPESGRYYDTDRAPYSWADYRIPTQVMVIEACRALGVASDTIATYQQWLLKQKQAQAWSNPLNSVNAVYALLMGNGSSLEPQPQAVLRLDDRVVEADQSSAALGYVNRRIDVADGQPAPRRLTIDHRADHLAWGSVYAQYLEDLDKVQADAGELTITRELLVRRVTDGREVWQRVQPGEALRVGDRVILRLTIGAARDMDFVQVVDRHAACLESGTVLSGYRYEHGLGYYRVVKDASVRYFIDSLRKGTYRLDTEFSVTRAGRYQSGTAVIQSAYAPALSAHTNALRVEVQE